MSPRAAIGLDFGTTNSAVAWVREGGGTELARFDAGRGPTEAFRSVLYFDRGEDGEDPLTITAGPFAVERYLAAEEKNGRLVQSLKSFLASRLFSATSIFGKSHRLEELIAIVLGALRQEAEARLGAAVEHVVVGRPVRFVHAEDESDAELALARLSAALRNAGFRAFDFEYEPVGAAYHYESDLDRDELILIADFGGGTSDFSLLRVGPSFREGGTRGESILGHAGVPVAGDAFDGKLVRHLVAPRLGRGAELRAQFGGVLPVPSWVYSQLERWHHLSLLKRPKMMRLLLDLRRDAVEPEQLDGLIQMVRHDLGFLLFRAVERTKRELSAARESRLRFRHDGLEIDVPVTRARFESWIAEELDAIRGCVDGLLERAGVAQRQVDRVFLTGGSSFVPAVRRIFEERFGPARIRSGGELTSVASGLARRALEPHSGPSIP